MTFYNRCNAVPQHKIVERREGKRTGRLSHGLQRGEFGGADYPLAVVQIDHTPLPVQLIDEVHGTPIGRPMVTVVIDLFSRMVVGFYLTLEAPGNLSTGLAISSAILPKGDLLKEHGISQPWPCSGRMRMICADNAGEFHGNMLKMACDIHRDHRLADAPPTACGWRAEVRQEEQRRAVVQNYPEADDRRPRPLATRCRSDIETWGENT